MDTIPIPEESQDQLAGRKHLQEMDQYWLPTHLIHTPTYTLLICNQNYSIKFPCRKTLLMQKSIVWASAKMLRRSCKQTFFFDECAICIFVRLSRHWRARGVNLMHTYTEFENHSKNLVFIMLHFFKLKKVWI